MQRKVLAILLLLMAGALVYSNALPGAFHFDDHPLILENPHVTGDSFRYLNFLDHYGGRPLTLWTFYLTHRWFGPESYAFVAFNILLHLCTVVLLFLLVGRICGRVDVAWIAALLFALHPLQTQAVNYSWSRSMLLMSVFGLLCLLLFRRFPVLSLLALQLAIWSRAEALVLVVPLLLMRRDRWKPVAALAGLNAVMLGFSLISYSPNEVAWNHPEPLSYWLAQPVILFRYLLLLLWPFGLTLEHDPALPSLWVSAMAVATWIISFGLFWKVRRQTVLPLLGLGWFVLFLLPSMSVPNIDLINESRVYLAVAGPLVLAAAAVARVRPGVVRLAVLAGLVLVLTPLTASRNSLWADDLALLEDAVVKSPEKVRARYNLGVVLAQRGELDRALREFRHVLSLKPDDDMGYAAVGYCLEIEGAYEAALQHYLMAVQLNPDYSYAWEGVRRLEARFIVGEQAPGILKGAVPQLHPVANPDYSRRDRSEGN